MSATTIVHGIDRVTQNHLCGIGPGLGTDARNPSMEITCPLCRAVIDRDHCPVPQEEAGLTKQEISDIRFAVRADRQALAEDDMPRLMATVQQIRDARPDTLDELRTKGNARRDRWHTPETEPWSGADWSNAMCGEAGEAANVVKKIRRIETGTGSQDALTELNLRGMLADELADTIAYADLLAQHYGIDLRAAIVAKFNEVSRREGFPERMTEPAR